MKKIIKLLVLFTIIISFGSVNIDSINAAEPEKLELIFTSDLHSNMQSVDRIIDGKQVNIGGFSRLKSFIDEKRAENENVLLVDDGDLIMGTLSQSLISTDAYELRFLGQFGYDVATFGNHEFDYGAEALSDMYSVAAKNSSSRPGYVVCNVDWSANDSYTKTLMNGLSEYGISEYVIVNKGNIKIAVTGCIGIDAKRCASTCELTILDPVESVKKTVAKIKATENPDMIVCLSHSGTGVERGNTEDEILAKKVPDIDVIVSGHTHTVLQECIQVGNTYIVSCGSFGVYTGEVSLEKANNGRWLLNKYKLHLMDSSIKDDDIVNAQLNDINKTIDEKVLKPYGYTANQIIAVNKNVQFEEQPAMEELHTETKLGNLLSDAYRCIANSTPTGRERSFDIAVAPSGTIRGSFVNGDISVGQAFEALSLGIGQDGLVGYPLVNFYITGKEVKTMTEVDASISDLMTTARLYTSGVCFEYNPYRPILNKVSDVWMCSPIMEDSRTELDENKMYRVVTDYYTMTMLGAVTDLSKGILKIVPKDENGNPVENYDERLVYDENGNELKAWTALARYLDSFPEDERGISVVPTYYNDSHNRKVVKKSLSPVAMLKNANLVTYIILIIVLALIITIVLIIRKTKKNKNKKKVLYQ